MLLLGIDLGTSFVKVSVIEAYSQKLITCVQYPENEVPIKSIQSGWAEQSPEIWWENTQKAILLAHKCGLYNSKEISAIGISYQMHGLVIVDKNKNVLRDAIIWCDSRAVEIGNEAFNIIGQDKCLSNLLNSPGNFTASKLAWVKINEPEIYANIYKVMLPGDFIAMKLTGEISTTASALSEGVFWDFKTNAISKDILNYFGFNENIFPKIKDVFSEHGNILADISTSLNLNLLTKITYKAGDQPNNALSLQVLKPGEVAATAGTSGVIYGISDGLKPDLKSRVNSFAHVNHVSNSNRLGVLLCINGTGIMNRWVKDTIGSNNSYQDMNQKAQKINVGSDGLMVLPFGNGAERMLNNKIIGAHFINIDFNLHTQAHIFRAVQEGICFSFRFGLDILRETGIEPKVIKVGFANLFLSEIFVQIFVNICNCPVELYKNEGSFGAALGAGIGSKVFNSFDEAFCNMKSLKSIYPEKNHDYEDLYEKWKIELNKKL